MNALSQSIESLYTAFSDVQKPRKIDACPCCIGAKNLCELQTKPLRELSPHDLSAYASSAFLTSGGVADYLYFLPRILEIHATNDSWWPEPEVTGRAISNTEPLSWPAKRLHAFHDFLHHVIASCFEIEDSGWKINSWICAIAKMRMDVRPYLSQIEASPIHVLSFYEVNANRLSQRRLSNPFWELPNEGYDQVVHWFGTQAVGDIIMAAYGVALYYSEQNHGGSCSFFDFGRSSPT